MYDFQKTVLIDSKPTTGTMVIRYVSLVLAVLSAAACVLLNPVLFLAPFIIFAILFWRMWFHSGLEYEYGYFDGDLSFDKIIDKRKRKKIIDLEMENVTQIAPKGDRSLYNVHQNPSTKYMDLTSRTSGGRVFEVVSQDAGNILCIAFEPDDVMLDAICVKHKSKVIR